MSKWKTLFGRGLKFSIVGLSGVFVGLSTLYILVEFFHFSKYVAWFPSAILSILNNFIWNNLFTWKDRKIESKKEIAHKLMLYYFFTIITMMINYAIYYFLIDLDLYYIYAFLIGVIIIAILNFSIGNFIIWKKGD